ncbi:alpha/beta fold hydrolase [Sphingomonas sp. Tas61C01]|uniref:alpha/beta fold hydrolase n=1 Tax=Sphingomonas sp. Tas61C01 TaxID=3458297 RepID=UPI00403E4ECE
MPLSHNKGYSRRSKLSSFAARFEMAAFAKSGHCGPHQASYVLRTMVRYPLLLAAVLATTPAGHGKPALASARDRFVSLSGGRVIALHCAGRGKFTVLLEPGDGGRRTHMALLFAALSDRYRVCAYDRRNVGGSSAAPLPRQAADLTKDAFDTLSAAKERGPYILFGTSMGGMLVRSYAASQAVAGFVTSNQPGTTREWVRFAYPVMSRSQRAADAAWMSGDNNEHIDVTDLSKAIEKAKPPRVPYVVMISTERFQCREAEICGPVYSAFVEASRAMAQAGKKGQLRVLDGDHDLYVTNLEDVLAAIDDVAFSAQTR